MTAEWLLAFAAPALLTAVLIPLLRRTRLATKLADHPNERSLHSTPTPRLGGLAMVVPVVGLGFWLGDAPLRFFWLIAAALAILSLADDLRSLPVLLRLSVHALAAALGVIVVAKTAGGLHPAWAALVGVAIAWMTNLFNFMDGSDGLAGGMALIGFSAYAVAAALAAQPALAIASMLVASAALGFLAFNFPPAKVFMGDAGSIPLGFLAGALGLHGFSTAAWPAWFPLAVFSPFIVDASVTLFRRVRRGERIWRAHREHYYQRLALAGWSASRLALAAYALMIAAATSALAALGAEAMLQCGILLGWFVAYVAGIFAIERRTASNGPS
jgi:UDP-N-acetylmuramyl pentapeptide phosphotransferase/UDP-N-acetylglucosamine-1-phosphate transferase